MNDLTSATTRLSRSALAIFGATLLGMAGLAVLSGARLQAETLPMQWGAGGAPVWFGPRVVSLWGLVAVFGIVGAMIAAGARWGQPTGSIASRSLVISAAIAATAQIFHVFMLMRWGGI